MYHFAPTSLRIETKTADFNAEPGVFYMVDVSSGSVVATLPTFDAGTKTLIFWFKVSEWSGGNTLTLQATDAKQIDNASEYILPITQDAVSVINEGAEWRVAMSARRHVTARVTGAGAVQTVASGLNVVILYPTVDNGDGVGFNNIETITAINTTTDKFTVAGDVTADYVVGRRMRIDGHPTHDGVQIITASDFSSPNTVIETALDLTDSTVAGTLSLQGIHIPRTGTYWIWTTMYLDNMGVDDYIALKTFVNDVQTFSTRMYVPTDVTSHRVFQGAILQLDKGDFIDTQVKHNYGANRDTSTSNPPDLQVMEA